MYRIRNRSDRHSVLPFSPFQIRGLCNPSALNDLEQDCNYGNYQKDVYKAAGTVPDKAYYPCYDQYYCYDV